MPPCKPTKKLLMNVDGKLRTGGLNDLRTHGLDYFCVFHINMAFA
jgi:hypothetical protein